MENFIVSARKYRPATFASVVGQRHITSTLKNAIERGQLAHAYLFCGPRGVGKTTCARIFAKAINCLNPQSGEACNECESCRTFNEGRSLNVHELDAASNNSVEDIRNLIEQVRVIPQVGRYSVFVIDEVHMLSTAAFNAFLKTLEEPPRHAIFVLATTEKHKIIPTILSRCQIYDFNRIKVEDGVEYLRYIADKEGVTADDEALNLIAHKADGGMRDALSMFDKAVSFCGSTLNYRDVAATLNVLDYDTYFSVTDMLIEGRYVDALMAFDNVLARGFSPQVFVSGLNAHMRDLLLSKGPAISLVEFTGTLVERYRTQAQRCDDGFLFNSISLLTEADGRLKQSSNQRLLVELGLMKIAGLGQKKNDDTSTLTLTVDCPLPDLEPASRVQASQPQPQPTPAPAPAPQSAEIEPSAQPVQSTPAAPKVEPTEQSGITATHSETTAETKPDPATNDVSAEPKPTTTAKTPTTAEPKDEQTKINTPRYAAHSAPKAICLTDMIDLSQAAHHKVEEQSAKEADTTAIIIDPASEQKMSRAKERFIEELSKSRPRHAIAFEQMTIEQNTITIEVASEELSLDIQHSQTDILNLMQRLAEVNGAIELKIVVNEEIKIEVPITLEARLKYMVDKNDRIIDLIERLGLDAE